MSGGFFVARDESGQPKQGLPSDEKQALDARQELRSILQKVLLENLDAQMKQAIENSQSDPHALARYKALYERRKQIGMSTTSAE